MAEKWQNATPIAPDMWRDGGSGVQLIGSVCESCGEIYFPKKEIAVCSHCQSEKIGETLLSPTGRIVSYTVAHQVPAGGFYKGPVPFAYVLVELPEGVQVQGHFMGSDFTRIAIGLAVRVVIDLLYEEEGSQVVTFKFAPVKEEERDA